MGGTEKDIDNQLRRIKENRAVFTDNYDGLKSSVEIITAQLQTEGKMKSIEHTDRSIYKFGMGTNADLDKFGNNPSGVALEIIYKKPLFNVQNQETEHKTSFDNMIELFKLYNSQIKGIKLEGRLNIEYNHDVVVSAKDTAETLKLSVETSNSLAGLVSQETYLKSLPDEILSEENIDDEVARITIDRNGIQDFEVGV